MEAANIYNQYKNQAVQTLTPSEMVVKLFDETAKQIGIAIYESERDRVKSFNGIVKATRVLKELNSSLNMNIPISKDLRMMYEYLIEALYEMGGAGDTGGMQQLLLLVNELKTAFRQAEKMARLPKVSGGM